MQLDMHWLTVTRHESTYRVVLKEYNRESMIKGKGFKDIWSIFKQ